MADVLDGWGGYASSYLEMLREDFPKACVVTYGLSDDHMGRHATMVTRREDNFYFETEDDHVITVISHSRVPFFIERKTNYGGK